MSEALLFAVHGENMLCLKIVLNVRNNFCTQHVLPRFELGIFMYWTCNTMNNLPSYFGLVDAKIRASDKDLPVPSSEYEGVHIHNIWWAHQIVSQILKLRIHEYFSWNWVFFYLFLCTAYIQFRGENCWKNWWKHQ